MPCPRRGLPRVTIVLSTRDGTATAQTTSYTRRLGEQRNDPVANSDDPRFPACSRTESKRSVVRSAVPNAGGVEIRFTKRRRRSGVDSVPCGRQASCDSMTVRSTPSTDGPCIAIDKGHWRTAVVRWPIQFCASTNTGFVARGVVCCGGGQSLSVCRQASLDSSGALCRRRQGSRRDSAEERSDGRSAAANGAGGRQSVAKPRRNF